MSGDVISKGKSVSKRRVATRSRSKRRAKQAGAGDSPGGLAVDRSDQFSDIQALANDGPQRPDVPESSTGTEAQRCVESDKQVATGCAAGTSNEGGNDSHVGTPAGASRSDPESANPGEGSQDLGHIVDALTQCVTFALSFCVAALDKWQRRVLDETRNPGQVAVVGANGIGKTVLIVILTLFFMARYRNCRVIITSGVGHQLEMFEEHLASILRNFVGWEIKRGSNELWAPLVNGFQNKAKWFTTERGGLAQGQHSVVEAKSYQEDELEAFAEAGGIIVLIRDECGEIPKDIKEAGDTYNARWVFNFGNAATAMGWWFDTFTINRHLYRTHTVTAYESSYWTKEQIEAKRQEWGADKFKMAIEAKFVGAGQNTLIPLSQVTSCVDINIPHTHSGFKVAGLDLSAAKHGGDECVLIFRLGNKVFAPVLFKGFTDEMAVVGEVIRTLRRERINHVFADAGGIGAPMIARMVEVLDDDKNIQIHRVHFGGTPVSDPKRKSNQDRAMEMYQNMADMIEARRIILPKDDILIGQLASRQYKLMSSGARRLVPKAEQREMCGKSPDRADALALALQEPPFQAPNMHRGTVRQFGMREVYEPEDPSFVGQPGVSADGFELGN